VTEKVLTEREKLVLEAVVLDFVKSAKPVGSRQISKNYPLEVSSATIRNTMADLEEMGYLTHPHTSAGRLPSDKGYRYYVDSLMQYSTLSSAEREAIVLQVDPNAQDIQEILKQTSYVLGQLSEELGIVMAPKFNRAVLEKLELVELSSDKLLVVIHIQSGIIKTVVIEVTNRIPRNRMNRVATLLNERLAGLTLKEVKHTIDERLRDMRVKDTEIVDLLVDNADLVFNFAERVDIHVSGAKNILQQPEMQDPEKITNFIDLVEQNDLLVHLFEDTDEWEDELNITIGSENKLTEITDYSIVSSTYRYGDLTGRLAILGPTRMPYHKVASVVQLTADIISSKLDQKV